MKDFGLKDVKFGLIFHPFEGKKFFRSQNMLINKKVFNEAFIVGSMIIIFV